MVLGRRRIVSDSFNGGDLKISALTQPDNKITKSTLTVTDVSGTGSVIVLPAQDYDLKELNNLISTEKPNQNATYVRKISSKMAYQAAAIGTDRTTDSTVHKIRGDTVTMREHEITDASQITYLKPISNGITTPPDGTTLLIYRGKGIKNITTTNPTVPFPNKDLYHFTGEPKDCLLAVITSAIPPTSISTPNNSMFKRKTTRAPI